MRFYLGLLIWLALSFSLVYFFNLGFRSILAFGGGMVYEPLQWVMTRASYFLAAFSCTLSLSLALTIWLGQGAGSSRKSLARGMALLTFWFYLFAFTSLSSLIVFWQHAYNSPADFWPVFRLLPIVIFLQSWYLTRLIYRSEKIILLSLAACLIFTFSVGSTSIAKPELASKAFALNYYPLNGSSLDTVRFQLDPDWQLSENWPHQIESDYARWHFRRERFEFKSDPAPHYWAMWHDTAGHLYAEGLMHIGSMMGEWKCYHKDGSIKLSANFPYHRSIRSVRKHELEQIRHGEWVYYDENGNEIGRQHYHYDSLLYEEAMNTDKIQHRFIP